MKDFPNAWILVHDLIFWSQFHSLTPFSPENECDPFIVAVTKPNYRYFLPKSGIMRTKSIFILFLTLSLFRLINCIKDNKENNIVKKSFLDTLTVTHSIKGWKIYSWPSGNDRYYSILVGTNSIKTYEQVTSNTPTAVHLITINGTNSLKLMLARFPESEYITLIGKTWLQNNWGGNYGNLSLPSQNQI